MSKLIERIIPEEWRMFMQSSEFRTKDNLLEYFEKLIAYVNSKSFYNKDDCHFINNGDTLFPSLDKCAEFLKRIKPDDVQLVVVVREPYNNGEATGIPLELDYTKSKPRSVIADYLTDLEVVEAAYALHINDIFTGINFNDYFGDGVLWYPTTLFSQEGKIDHWRKYFLDFSRYFLKALNKPVVSLGDSEVISLLDEDMKLLAPLPSNARRRDFINFKVFEKIKNKYGYDFVPNKKK